MIRGDKAIAAGFTVEAHICIGMYDLDVMVRPDVDTDSEFRAYDLDCDEWLMIMGWNIDHIELEH